MSPWVWAAAALCGGGATLARFLLDSLIAHRAGCHFPFGTLAINASGALLLGLLAGLAVKGSAMVILGTAAIGSYTTFSTWMLETHRLSADSKLPHAAANASISLAVGLGAVALGRAIGAHV